MFFKKLKLRFIVEKCFNEIKLQYPDYDPLTESFCKSLFESVVIYTPEIKKKIGLANKNSDIEIFIFIVSTYYSFLKNEIETSELKSKNTKLNQNDYQSAAIWFADLYFKNEIAFYRNEFPEKYTDKNYLLSTYFYLINFRFSYYQRALGKLAEDFDLYLLTEIYANLAFTPENKHIPIKQLKNILDINTMETLFEIINEIKEKSKILMNAVS